MGLNMDRLTSNCIPFNGNSRPVPWEIALASYLVALIHAQGARIRRLEFFDRQKAVHIDEQRRQAERRAA